MLPESRKAAETVEIAETFEEGERPANIIMAAAQGAPLVTTDELKRMMDAKEDFVLANALSPMNPP